MPPGPDFPPHLLGGVSAGSIPPLQQIPLHWRGREGGRVLDSRTKGRFALRLLGRFTVAAEGAPAIPIRISSKKARALLAVLAMSQDQAAPREQLATLLWGSSPDAQARHSLSQAVAVLRKELAAPHLIDADGELIQL